MRGDYTAKRKRLLGVLIALIWFLLIAGVVYFAENITRNTPGRALRNVERELTHE